jgi:hypothetical protein
LEKSAASSAACTRRARRSHQPVHSAFCSATPTALRSGVVPCEEKNGGEYRIRKWAPCSTSGPSDYRAEESNNLKGKVKVERQLVGLPWAADCCPWVKKNGGVSWTDSWRGLSVRPTAGEVPPVVAPRAGGVHPRSTTSPRERWRSLSITCSISSLPACPNQLPLMSPRPPTRVPTPPAAPPRVSRRLLNLTHLLPLPQPLEAQPHLLPLPQPLEAQPHLRRVGGRLPQAWAALERALAARARHDALQLPVQVAHLAHRLVVQSVRAAELRLRDRHAPDQQVSGSGIQLTPPRLLPPV